MPTPPPNDLLLYYFYSMRKRSYSRSILSVLCSAVLITTVLLLGLNILLKYQPGDAYKEPRSAPLTTNDNKTSSTAGIITDPEPPPSPTSSLAGVLQEKYADRLVIQTESSTTVQIILSNQNLQIYKETLKTPKQIQQELHLRSASAVMPPSPSRQEKTVLTDIPLGSWLRITPGENLLTPSSDTMTAAEIIYVANK